MNHGGLHLPMLQQFFSLNKKTTAFAFCLAAGGGGAALSEPPIVPAAVIGRELLGEEAAHTGLLHYSQGF